ncbi:DUF3630 family protein [Marinobacter hydrocarbonoclasticus]|nr:DUF3630 family protein [Marinobacter nauticus]
MESTAHSLLLKLGQPQYSAERHQLIWPCPLTQEQAGQLVPALMGQLECQLGPMEQGADRLFWTLSFEETALSLQYEALCESLWIQPGEGAQDGEEVVAFLARQVGAEHV